MRDSLVFSLTLLISAAAVGAEAPIPQDTARMEARSRERLEWHRRTLQGEYDKVGKKDPRWDKAAREALDLTSRMFAQQTDPTTTLLDIHVPAKQAIDAGCDDPLVLYVYARSSVATNFPGVEEYTRRIEAAADAMSASAYSPYRRAAAKMAPTEMNAWKKDLTPEQRRAVGPELDAVLDLLPKSVAEDVRGEDWELRWYDLINQIIAAHKQLSGDYRAAFDRVDARLAMVPGIEALRLTVKGNFLLKWGWEARTRAFAAAVTEAQFRTFETRLREARAVLNEAWKTKPDEPHIADLMLSIEKSIGGGDREAMETWFERAMKADGDDQEACWQKLDWLDPKWYGGETADEMLAFGEACRATKNWRTGITLLAADAHFRFCSRFSPAERMRYLGSPEVWSEIQSVYDEYLKHHPFDDVQRSKYAALCYYAGHLPEAHALFQTLGDRLTVWPTFPNAPLSALKAMRTRAARSVANTPREGDAPSPKNEEPAKPPK